MGVSLAYIDNILRNISLYHKDRILVTADIQTLALTDGRELSAVMLSYDLSERIFLLTGLLDVLSAAAVCLSLKLDVITHRLCELQKVII